MGLFSHAPLSLGISPCPNDTFIFHALLHGFVAAPAQIVPRIADVEELNRLAARREMDVTKLSLGAVPAIVEDYVLLSSGAALGFNCGPLVVAREPLPESAWRCARVAVPGLLTTANLLLTLHGGFNEIRQEMLFSEVMPAVARGDADLGVIIHEGRFTYQHLGLTKILDLGQWWEGAFRLPLPLGAIAVRRDLPGETALAVQEAIARSLAYAREHPLASRDFVRANAQELEESVTEAHIRTFVTDYSLDLGEAGKRAIEILVGLGAELTGKSIPKEGLFLPS